MPGQINPGVKLFWVLFNPEIWGEQECCVLLGEPMFLCNVTFKWFSLQHVCSMPTLTCTPLEEENPDQSLVASADGVSLMQKLAFCTAEASPPLL